MLRSLWSSVFMSWETYIHKKSWNDFVNVHHNFKVYAERHCLKVTSTYGCFNIWDYLCLPPPQNHWPRVPSGWPFHGRDVAVYVFNINQLSLPTPFYSALGIIFCLYDPFTCSINFPVSSLLSHFVPNCSINFPVSSLLSHFVPDLFLPCYSFQLYISLKVFLNFLWRDRLFFMAPVFSS